MEHSYQNIKNIKIKLDRILWSQSNMYERLLRSSIKKKKSPTDAIYFLSNTTGSENLIDVLLLKKLYFITSKNQIKKWIINEDDTNSVKILKFWNVVVAEQTKMVVHWDLSWSTKKTWPNVWICSNSSIQKSYCITYFGVW